MSGLVSMSAYAARSRKYRAFVSARCEKYEYFFFNFAWFATHVKSSDYIGDVKLNRDLAARQLVLPSLA